jgi:hypothetical protein
MPHGVPGCDYFVTLPGRAGTFSRADWDRFSPWEGCHDSDGRRGAAEPAGRYAIVVRKDVAGGPWSKVVRSPEDVGAYHPR